MKVRESKNGKHDLLIFDNQMNIPLNAREI